VSSVELGTLLFLFSETIFFVFLLISYINFHLGPAHESMTHDLDVMRTTINTVFLILSSFTAWRAHSAFLRGKTGLFSFMVRPPNISGSLKRT
jgi:heme/copper-type cytochrome/quinol oxidase subunit 3